MILQNLKFFSFFFAFFFFCTKFYAVSSAGAAYHEKAYQELSNDLKKKIVSSNMDYYAPIVIRIYKEERVLEIWKENRNHRFTYLISYPICQWSGLLGPKYLSGDLQSPEGFYQIFQNQLNPYSHYYLSANIGYPNYYDKSHGRTGGSVMIHGGCRSVGCYAMTDKNMGQIYALMRDALSRGQKFIQVQAYPFRMTQGNMKRYQKDPNYNFWLSLKRGSDLFEKTGRPPIIKIIKKQYFFVADNSEKIASLQTKSFSDYGGRIFDFLHGLRFPEKSLSGLSEAKKIAQWTKNLVHGDPVKSLIPPYSG